ncbi:MAG: hypothetical protein R2867_22700 [Caldilineaceae bacterium]
MDTRKDLAMYDMEQSKTDGLNSYYRRLQQVDFYLEANLLYYNSADFFPLT